MLDNATQPCHSPLDTDGDPPATDCAPCGATNWHCVRTNYGAERLAAIEIGVNGFEVFYPTLWIAASPARRYTNGSVRAARPARVIPVFARYMFVRFDLSRDPWRQILRMPGVEGIISNTPEKPSVVPQDAIDGLRALTHENGCIYPSCPGQTPIARGSRVKVLRGALLDHDGVCQSTNGARVRLLMEIMGRPVTVSLPQSDVEAA